MNTCVYIYILHCMFHIYIYIYILHLILYINIYHTCIYTYIYIYIYTYIYVIIYNTYVYIYSTVSFRHASMPYFCFACCKSHLVVIVPSTNNPPIYIHLPSGIKHNYGNSPCSMEKSTINGNCP